MEPIVYINKELHLKDGEIRQQLDYARKGSDASYCSILECFRGLVLEIVEGTNSLESLVSFFAIHPAAQFRAFARFAQSVVSHVEASSLCHAGIDARGDIILGDLEPNVGCIDYAASDFNCGF